MWNVVAQHLPFQHSPHLTEFAPGELLVTPSRKVARISRDGGVSWTELAGVSGRLCTPRHIVGYDGAWTSDDGWRTFRTTDTPGQQWHGLLEVPGSNIWGRRGRSLMRFHEGRWRRVKVGLRSLILAVVEAHGRIVVSAGKDRWACSTDGGQTWPPFTMRTMSWLQPTHDGFLAMKYSDKQMHGPVFFSSDGITWTQRGQSPVTPSNTDTSYVRDDVIILVARGRVVRSDDGGLSWRRDPSFPELGYYAPKPSCLTAGVEQLWMVSSDTLWCHPLPAAARSPTAQSPA